MVRRKNEMRTDPAEHLQGGRGVVTKLHALTADEMNNEARLFGTLSLPPGASIGDHRHTGEMEAFYILRGEGLYHDGETNVQVFPGDVTLVQAGDLHGIENTGEEDLVLLAAIFYTG